MPDRVVWLPTQLGRIARSGASSPPGHGTLVTLRSAE